MNIGSSLVTIPYLCRYKADCIISCHIVGWYSGFGVVELLGGELPRYWLAILDSNSLVYSR